MAPEEAFNHHFFMVGFDEMKKTKKPQKPSSLAFCERAPAGVMVPARTGSQSADFCTQKPGLSAGPEPAHSSPPGRLETFPSKPHPNVVIDEATRHASERDGLNRNRASPQNFPHNDKLCREHLSAQRNVLLPHRN
jgi:hypothetical protein